LPKDTASGVVKALLDQFVVFDYATKFAAEHPSIDSIELFEFNDWAGFSTFLASKNFSYVSHSEQKIKELKELSKRENWMIGGEITAMENKIAAEKVAELERSKDKILHELEQEIVGRYYFQRGKVRKSLVNDPEVKEAVKLLNDMPRYSATLKSK
jgi:carboxyl-terminal processing protease